MKKILIIDIETTGLEPDKDFIAEVGMVELNLSNGERKIVFDRVCFEEGVTKDIVSNSWIVKNNYMKISDFKSAVNFKQIKNNIQTIINRYPNGSTAYNSKFDFGFLESRGVKFPNKLSCPMKVSTNICKIPARQGPGYKWPKVEEAYKFFFPDSNYNELHRGADDAMHEAEIVYELYKRGELRVI